MKRALLALAILALPATAQAGDPVDTCVDAADRAQSLRDDGKLIEARENILLCAASSCPTVVAKQCVKWLHEVDGEMPTVLLRVRDAEGRDVGDAEVRIDGDVKAGALAGLSIAVNPGPHKLVFHRVGSADAEESMVIRAGDKNRVVDVQLKAATATLAQSPPVTPERHRAFRFPWTTGVFLGVGVASFVTMGVLVGIASSDASTLRATCAPHCATTDVDAVQTKLTVANVMMGVGIGSVAVSALLLVLANTGGAPKEKTAVSFGVGPMPGGAAVGATGRF